MTGVGLLRLHLMDYCPFISLWTLIYSFLFSIYFSLLFQICMMHKEAHHPSSLEILMRGLQVFLVQTRIYYGGEITSHYRI